MNRNALIHAAIEVFGREHQTLKAIEEMAELTQAIIKCESKPSMDRLSDLHDEISDVQITLDQLKIIYGYDPVEELSKRDKLEELIMREVQK